MSKEFVIKLATPEMVPEMHAIDVADWGEKSAATPEMMLERIKAFLYGNFVAVDRTGRVLGSVWSVATDEQPFTSWIESTGAGIYRNANPFGEWGFGVNLSVRGECSGMGIGVALIQKTVDAFWTVGRRHWRFGGRIPEYHTWAEVFTAEDYIHLYRDDDVVVFLDPATGLQHKGPAQKDLAALKHRIDPREWPVAEPRSMLLKALDGELAFFKSLVVNGQRPQVYRLQSNYFSDPDSLNYGVLMGADNPDVAWE